MSASPAASVARDRTTPVALAVLACALLARWAEAWNNYPDLSHAWAVPALAAYLAWERRVDCPPAASVPPGARASSPWLLVAIAALLALPYLAGRVLLAPFPAWPAALWLFSLAGWGLALGLIAASGGVARARHFAFPILFTATALPWLTWMDVRLILPLRAGLATIAAEVVHALGYPTSVAGTVITVGRGQVGVDEACSGIRSLQTVIMLALFLGELLRLRVGRRLALLAIGIALALASNLARTCFLAWQAATRGPEAATLWHDRAGELQLLVALGGLVVVAWRWNRFARPAVATVSPAPSAPSAPGWRNRPVATLAAKFAIALAALVIIAEAGVAVWFRPAPRIRAAADWRAALPANEFTYRSEAFGPVVHDLLRYDDYHAGAWETPEGHRRAGYVLEWARGEIARDVIALHNPEVCLPIGGRRLLSGGEIVELPTATGASLPFRIAAFTSDTGEGVEAGAFFVFYLAWDVSHARSLAPASDTGRLGWWRHRLGEVAARRGRFAARVVALAIHDEPDLDAATAAFLREAPALFTRDRN